tara:strand:+ start:116 stop:493 length:378 start_codon:yes stop_codon:yes gene_type:complete
MLRSFLIFVTFTFPSICFGDYEWKLITTTENSDFYVDMKSLTIKDNKRFYLRLRDYKKIDKYGERSNIIYFETDCTDSKSRFLKDIYFEENMGKGEYKVLDEVGDWIIFKKGSVGDYFVNQICSL